MPTSDKTFVAPHLEVTVLQQRLTEMEQYCELLKTENEHLRQCIAELRADAPRSPQPPTEPATGNTVIDHEQEFIRILLDTMLDGVVACDASGNLIMFNRAAHQWHGVDPRAMEPSQWANEYNLCGGDGVTPLAMEEIPLLRAFNGETIRDFAMSILARGQPPRHILADADPLFDVDGRKIGALALMHDITERKRAEEALRLFKLLVENALDGIVFASLDGVIQYSNQSYATMTGFGAQVVGSRIPEYYFPEDMPFVTEELLPTVTKQGNWQGMLRLRRPDGSAWFGQASLVLLTNEAGTPLLFTGSFRDVTEQRRAEEERTALQQQIIAVQQSALRELSTPLIPLSERVVIMPLIGTIDSTRAQQVMETLLDGIAHYQSQIAILDITGVQVVDTEVANALIRAAQAVKLLGAQVMLTGIQPRIAQILVQLGVDLSGIITHGTLQAGIASALNQSGRV